MFSLQCLQNNIQMNTLTWYINLYYKFRQYPISQINATYKSNELRPLYTSMLKKLFILFQLDNRRDGQIQGIISKNNYDHMLNKKAESNLEQEEAALPNEQDQEIANGSRPSFESVQIHQAERDSLASLGSQSSKWLVHNGPNQKNMDVFYELMIKMIRISFRRLTIQAFAFDRYGKDLKKQGMHEVIRNNSEYSQLFHKIAQENQPSKQINEEFKIQNITFPTSIEELKYEFLKYCITCKVYNSPVINNNSPSSSLISYNSSQDSLASHTPVEHIEQKPVPPPIVGDNQIQTLILKVSDKQTCIFNSLMDVYMEEIRKNGNNQIEIFGVNHIAQSIFEMSAGKAAFNTATNSLGINRNLFRRGIFDQYGEYAKQSEALSNSNLLLATWFDLILFKEHPTTLFEIIQKLVSLGDHNSYLSSVQPKEQAQYNGKFYLKVSSYLHLLILNSTKNIFIQSLCKINYLLVISQDLLGQSQTQARKAFKDIKLKNYEANDGKTTNYYENVKLTYDSRLKKNLWKQEAMELLLAKWKIIANVITEACVKNSKIFFASIFERCAKLLDQQLDFQVQLVNELMQVNQNITLEKQIKQREDQKCEYMKKGLNGIIREIIGFAYGSVSEQDEEQKILGINNFSKGHNQRYKESSFVNREESAQELTKWTQIINQNIYIFKQYKENLKQISQLFRNNHIYIALWFNKFHVEAKILLKKLTRPKLDRVFTKFIKQMPILWESMNSQKQQKQKRNKNRLKRCEKSKFRNRISSIKTESPLSLTNKKAIVLNYMIKAQLELYSHYMQINVLNNQKNLYGFFQKEQMPKSDRQTRPQIFSHKLIKQLMLFSIEDQQAQQVKEIISSPIRKKFRHYTSNYKVEPKSFEEIENIRTMNNIQKNQVNSELQQLMKVINHFDKPMNIELDLKQDWKDRFGDVQVSFLAQVSDYIRYLNQINYLYQFWSWTEQAKNQQIRKTRIQLLNGAQFQNDLSAIDNYFDQAQNNREYMNELQLMKGEKDKLIKEEQLSEMVKKIKIHNKELYMINQTIIEAENYYKLVGCNLIGRDKNRIFKKLLEDAILTYKLSKKERTDNKIGQSIQNQSASIKKEYKRHHIRFQDQQNKNLIRQTSLRQTLNSASIAKMKKNHSFVSYFQFTPEYYKIQSKILRINCLIASFDINNSIYKNIKSFRALSNERINQLAIIGNKYYEKLQLLLDNDRGEDQSELTISEQLLVRIKNVYQKKLLLIINTLINLNYDMEGKLKKYSKDRSFTRRQFTNIPEEHLKNYSGVVKKYIQILKKFIYCKIRENIKRVQQRQKFEQANNENQRKQNREFTICKFIEEILELSEKKQYFTEQTLLINLQSAVQKETNLKFAQEFKTQFQCETLSLQVYKTEEQKVDYLRKKLSYLLMRQIYFNLNYDNDFLNEKSVNSKRNYSIYQQRISSFYEQVIKLDYEQYMQRKQQQMKKRSIHLKDYEFKYEKQPSVCVLEKSVNQLICCLFNQLLITYTTSAQYKMFTRKHKALAQNQNPHQLFNQYCASQYSKKINKDNQPIKKKEKKKRKPKVSLNSIFAQIFESKSSQCPPSFEEIRQQQQNDQNKITVLLYTHEKFQLNQSIKLYLKILGDFQYNINNTRKSNFVSGDYSLKQEPITELQLQTIKTNERSLITMLKSDFLQKINAAKCTLIRKNLISNIQKLYINLDVRHKVFESFKDRILNYEMQKTKIYHQYMDYIRGLKLDVYSHMAGQNSLPYIKIIHAVKLYRLQVKKLELEQRVNQQFQKNLQKWNIGIQRNMNSYDLWLVEEEKIWKNQQERYIIQKKNLFEIFHVVSKQMARQNKSLKKNTLLIENQALADHSIVQVNLNNLKQMKKDANLSKKSILKQKPTFMNIKKQQGQTIYKAFNKSQKFIVKEAISETTKPYTKHQKMSNTSKSQLGLRGLFIKYDLSNLQKKQSLEDEKGRKTEICNSNFQVSTLFKKQQKRYLSAQKYRTNYQQY